MMRPGLRRGSSYTVYDTVSLHAIYVAIRLYLMSMSCAVWSKSEYDAIDKSEFIRAHNIHTYEQQN